MDKKQQSDVVAYVPVVHRAYLDLFDKHPDSNIGVLDSDVLSQFRDLRKDIRALEPAQAAELLSGYYPERTVRLIGRSALAVFAEDDNSERLIMPDDEVSRTLISDYFPSQDIQLEPVFLRWDRSNIAVDQDVEPNRVIKPNPQQLMVLDSIYASATKSSNWWRRVGAAILTTDGNLRITHNQHQPTAYSPWIDGDPRSSSKRGTAIELTTDQHAEGLLIAEAARNGTQLEGSELFVDTFPCPLCAKQIAAAGIKRCYYVTGYAMLDGQTVLKDAGVELVRFDYTPPSIAGGGSRPYPESTV